MTLYCFIKMDGKNLVLEKNSDRQWLSYPNPMNIRILKGIT